jgi:hypothetical protein
LLRRYEFKTKLLQYHIYCVGISESLTRLFSVARIRNWRTTEFSLCDCFCSYLRKTGAPLTRGYGTPTLMKAHYNSINQSQRRFIISLEGHVSPDPDSSAKKCTFFCTRHNRV